MQATIITGLTLRLSLCQIAYHGTRLINNDVRFCVALYRVLLANTRPSATMYLANLHRPPVRARIKYKVALLTFKILTTHQPMDLRGTNIDDLERPWTPKIGGFSEFLAILGCNTHFKSELRWNHSRWTRTTCVWNVCIKRRFQRCKVWPPRFKESSVRAHQIWVPP